ncbi:MAG: amidohydrolase family protein [Clostridiaceae bacterium]|jgi:dihydropyrimidinase|nr:amidohydrolase family protein [Clostridiaceae bacterium]
MYDHRIINGQVYQDGEFIDTNVYINAGKIALLSPEIFDAEQSTDASGLFVAPGIIDAHVHISLNGAGGNLSCDDYHSGSIAAAYGGVTTFIDFLGEAASVAEMRDFFREKMAITKDVLVDYALHASAKELKDSAGEMADQAVAQGTPSIKLYTTYRPSGIYSSPQTVEAFIERSAQADVRIIIHAEDDALINHENKDARNLAQNRPPECEIEEVRKIAEWTRKHRGNSYIVHVNCGETIEMLKNEYSDILHKNLFLESAPQYFVFDESVYGREDYYRYTITPPLRSVEQGELLRKNWREISVFATDHCPFTLDAKRKAEGNLAVMPMGMGGLEYLFPLMHSFYGKGVIDRLTVNPAKMFGLYPQKGVIAPGSDADIVLYREGPAVIDELHSAADDSPYLGLAVNARVVSTMSRGKWVVEDGELKEGAAGKFVFGRL